MKKGIIFLLAASTLFGLGFMGQTEKVEAAEPSFVKVTEAPTSWDGTYLIVYEAGNVAFDGGLPTLDAVSNTVSVTIENNKIAYTDALGNATFSIEGSYLKSSSGYYIGRSATSNGLNSSKTSSGDYTNTFTINSNGTAKITAKGGTVLKYNNTSGQNRFRYYKSGQQDICLYKLNEGTGGDVEEPDTPIVPEDKSPEVNALFTSYYNEGSYTKYSVLNTNEIADEEVKKQFFHAGADTKYRKTVYTPAGLKMTTKDTENGEYTNESIYANGNNCVNHTGFGGNWTVNEYSSVEDWFVTLKDFVDNPGAGWTYENGVYSLELNKDTDSTLETEENDLTRMAREFVAPMWLAPNDVSENYVLFTKLTVEEVNNTLIMKLYVHNENSGLLEDDANNVLSQITITKESESLSTLATFEFGANGDATHDDGQKFGPSKSYTSGSYSLALNSLTNVYGPAYDAKGNSCIKLGNSSATGSFTFTVPEDVNKVIIHVGKYKTNATKITVNGTAYTLTKNSNDGEYDVIEVNTTSTKTVSFTTVSGGVRCMINTIEFSK